MTLPFCSATAICVDGKEPRGRNLLGPDRRLDAGEDSLTDVGMLAQERGRVLAPLAEPLVAEAEVRARLLDDLALEPGVEDRSLPGDARSRR